MKPTLFISDLHLSASRPAMVGAFERFCAGPAREAIELYVLGDLFDTWAGDEQLSEPLAAGVAAALAGVAAAGTAVAVMRGNRDLLLGERFAAASGARLLPDTIVAGIAGTPTLLLHGDTLCTDDAGYQRYRARVHDPVLQRRFLAHLYGNEPDRWHDDLAGYDRLRAIVNAMTRLRVCTVEGAMDLSFKGEPGEKHAHRIPWFDMPARASATHTIVCGHWSALGLYVGEKVISLDSGCVWGRALTAVRLGDRRLWQVPCPGSGGPEE